MPDKINILYNVFINLGEVHKVNISTTTRERDNTQQRVPPVRMSLDRPPFDLPRRGSYPKESQVAAIQSMDAVDTVQPHPVVYDFLKPEDNVMLDSSQAVELVDYSGNNQERYL